MYITLAKCLLIIDLHFMNYASIIDMAI